ncbi:hypothetical protein L228DRAFT_235398 [Xylona heveae TC161]|uniref:DUF7905 domain-containing protein n=1 Tax=Xylona heveae (strain CBS 132557 / TC161) TaxID=1328760 RepID=A0A165JJB4_XYLHT|nr:hypothetical protein L228DRAFT_235398 [Xylona heveae TC161]KZF26310.1 hypothetical protein L228DRAFT_235398 [Xylona heveae TC161]
MIELTLSIWGSPEKIIAAKQELAKWVQRFKYSAAQKNEGARAAFGKVLAISEKKKKQLARQMEDDASRQKYKQSPCMTETFKFIGYFHWPVEEIRPESILGKSFEAFDHIRMHAAFKVLSQTFNELDVALSRIRGTLCEIMTRSNRPVTLYLVAPPSVEAVRTEVELEERKMGLSRLSGVVPRLTGPKLSKTDQYTWVSLRPKLAAANAKLLRKATSDCLRTLKFYRGHISMRVRFGTLFLSSYRKAKADRHGLMEFLEMMKCVQVAGELDKESPGDCESNGDLLSRCCLATDVLEPADAMTSGLENVQPVFSASFEVTDPSIHETFRLDIEFHKAVDVESFEISSKRWFKVGKQNPQGRLQPISRNVPLSVKSLNVEKGTAWQLEVTADSSVDISRITPEMREFADRIKLNVNGPSNANTSSPSITFKEILEIHGFTERRSFRYMMKGSTYIFEVAESTTFAPGNPSNGQKWASKKSEQVATFYNREWDTIFGQNSSLGIGEPASWNDSLVTFFSREEHTGGTSSEVGLADFAQRVELILQLIENDR